MIIITIKMSLVQLNLIATLVAVVLLLPTTALSGSSSSSSSSPPKVLFLTNSERGQANVQLATAHALLVDHADAAIEVHFASFPAIADAVARVSRQAQKKITFHPLDGPSFEEAAELRNITINSIRHPPGLRSAAGLSWVMRRTLVPWDGPDYVAVYESSCRIIEEVDPAVVVVDVLLQAGADAARALNRSYLFLAPNSLKDGFISRQPMSRGLWYYPA